MFVSSLIVFSKRIIMFDGFGVRFKQIRTEHKLTQAEMGQRLGISLPTVHRVENCEIPSRTDVVLALIEQFDCDATWLLTGKVGPTSQGIPVVHNLKDQEALGLIQLPEISRGERAIKVTGDDLLPTIRSGDYVIYVEETPKTGDVVLFVNQWNEIHARRYRDINGAELIAEHLDFPAIKVNRSIKIIGKALQILRCVTL
jgi:transcriptional regulator with XRE-family HTH domain